MKKILLSLHEVSPLRAPEVAALCRRLDEAGAVRRTLLVVPDCRRRAPLRHHKEWCRTLAAMRETGSDLGLYGFHGAAAECAFLSRDAAFEKIAWARAEFLAGFGFLPTGFAAPRWLLSGGCKQALIDLELLYMERWTGLFDRRGNRIEAGRPVRQLPEQTEGVIRLVLRPQDVHNGRLEVAAKRLQEWIAAGWSVCSSGDAANEREAD